MSSEFSEVREEKWAEWRTLPDNDLRRIYRKLTKRQRIMTAVTWIPLLPAAIIYGVIGWASFIASELMLFRSFVDTGVTGFLDFLFFSLCGAALSSRNERTFIFIPFAYIVCEAFKYLVFGNFSGILQLCYLIAASIILKPTVSDLNYLRSLPTFPFSTRQREINISGMDRDKMLSYLKNAEKGGAHSVGLEEIFESEHPEEIVSPPEKTEEYLQQHKLLYRNRDRWD